MDTFIKIAAIPLANGILSALIFLFTVRLLEKRIGFFGIKQWVGKHLTVYEGCKIVGGIITLFVAIYGAYSGAHKDFCDKREQYAGQIIELIPKISYAVNYEIGAGNVCYTYDGNLQ
ncbi:MAG: hypothetical protein Q7S29_01515 [Candidatus Peribacter sp.]|nr:hypothetical protein [Candidatus Peribacter sp.]